MNGILHRDRLLSCRMKFVTSELHTYWHPIQIPIRSAQFPTIPLFPSPPISPSSFSLPILLWQAGLSSVQTCSVFLTSPSPSHGIFPCHVFVCNSLSRTFLFTSFVVICGYLWKIFCSTHNTPPLCSFLLAIHHPRQRWELHTAFSLSYLSNVGQLFVYSPVSTYPLLLPLTNTNSQKHWCVKVNDSACSGDGPKTNLCNCILTRECNLKTFVHFHTKIYPLSIFTLKYTLCTFCSSLWLAYAIRWGKSIP